MLAELSDVLDRLNQAPSHSPQRILEALGRVLEEWDRWLLLNTPKGENKIPPVPRDHQNL